MAGVCWSVMMAIMMLMRVARALIPTIPLDIAHHPRVIAKAPRGSTSGAAPFFFPPARLRLSSLSSFHVLSPSPHLSAFARQLRPRVIATISNA
ncbi:MAG: hypothetical protein ACJ8BW_26765, partial [Ktedonobacteraceae bacterium]